MFYSWGNIPVKELRMNLQPGLIDYQEAFDRVLTRLYHSSSVLQNLLDRDDMFEVEGKIHEEMEGLKRKAHEEASIYSRREALKHLVFDKKEAMALKTFNDYWDRGECWACGEIVGEQYLERGHLIDRVCGGSDYPSNIMPMCNLCNRVLKPCHENMEEVLKWREEMHKYPSCIRLAIEAVGLHDNEI